MSALITALLAALLTQQPADSPALSGIVVDPTEKPVSGVEVVLAGRIIADLSIVALARTTTDDQGAFRLELDRQRLKGTGPLRFIWAYQPGRTVGVQTVGLTGNGALPSVRLTLAKPLKRTLNVLDSEGRPLAGARIAPVAISVSQGILFQTPDDRVDRLTVVTGSDGVATLECLPASIDPRTVRVSVPGMAPHDLPLPFSHGSDRFTLNRAQQLIADQKTPGEQACAWAVLALGLADRDKPAARAALYHSIQLIDGLLDRAGTPERSTRRVSLTLNPAASILPIVEKVAPECLEEVFWKAVALMPIDEIARGRGVPDIRAAAATIFLARYERQAADVFLTQATASAPRGMIGNIRFVSRFIRIKACVDPRAAAAMFESLGPVGDDPNVFADGLALSALDDLIESLIEPNDEHWKHAWRGPTVPFEKPFP